MSQSFVFPNALQDKFCFPIYMYPISLLPVTLLAVLRHQCFTPLIPQNIDPVEVELNELIVDTSEYIPLKAKSIQFPNKEPIIGLFLEYTPLSYDITILIIDQYYYDPIFEEMQREKATAMKRKTMQNKFEGYILLSFMFHLSGYFIIFWINLEWMMANDCSAWIAMQSLCLNMLILHPFSKLCALYMTVCNLVHSHDYGTEYGVSLFSKLFILMLIPFGGGVIIYLLPSFMYYPTWIICGCIFVCYCCCWSVLQMDFSDWRCWILLLSWVLF